MADSTIYSDFKVTGDVTFTATSSGLSFGELYVYSNATTSTIATATPTQMTIFDTAGESNNTTVSVANSDITILTAGMYLVTVSAAFSGDGNVTWYGGVYKNNGATQLQNLQTVRKLGASGDVGSISISGIAAFDATDTVEVWFYQEEGVDKDITVVNCTLSVVQVGA